MAAADIFLVADGLGAEAPMGNSIPVKAAAITDYDWGGFYVGGTIGLALGNSGWTAHTTSAGAPPVSGSLDMYRSPDAFYESGSWLIGVQGGYNYVLYSRVVFVADARRGHL